MAHLPSRGVYRESCPDKPGYVSLTVIDSQGRILRYGEMITEWCDQDCIDDAHDRLALSDPDGEVMSFSLRLKLTPAGASVLPFPARENVSSSPPAVPAHAEVA